MRAGAQEIPRSTFTAAGWPAILTLSVEKLICRGQVKLLTQLKAMGDRSPKSTQKKSSQKQAKASSAAAAKQAAVASKQVAGKKR